MTNLEKKTSKTEQAVKQDIGAKMPEAEQHDKLEDKIYPIVDSMMKKVLGVRVEELSKDISDKLVRKPYFSMEIDTSLPFLRAKYIFKRSYLLQLLRRHYGNISDVAKLSGIDRRSIHRLVKPAEVRRIRADMPNPLYIRKEYLGEAISDVLSSYKKVIHPKMLREAYKSVPAMSEDIATVLPETPMSLAEAELEFEREYFKKILEETKHNMKKTAERTRLRYETLLRKIKKLQLLQTK